MNETPTQTAGVTRLEIAQSPAKERMLKMLDKLREEVARGDVISLLALTIRTGEQFDVDVAGEIRMAALAGILGRAHLDALEAMESAEHRNGDPS